MRGETRQFICMRNDCKKSATFTIFLYVMELMLDLEALQLASRLIGTALVRDHHT